jgi:hypothetical protein
VQSGLWWNPNEPGSGFSIDIQNQSGFIAWYSYSSSGSSAFYTVQGVPERPAELQRRSSGVAVRLKGPVLSSQGGAPPGAAWQQNTSVASGLGEAEFVFFDSRRGEVRIGTRVIPIQPFNTSGVQEDKMLLGRWALTWRFVPGEVSRVQVEVTEAPSTFQYSNTGFFRPFDPIGGNDSRYCDGPATAFLPNSEMPPADAKVYLVSCLEGCTAIGPSPPGLGLAIGSADLGTQRYRSLRAVYMGNWTFWYSPSQRRYGRVANSGDGLTTCADPADLFVTQDRVVARARRVVPFPGNTTPIHHTEFVLSRMPDESFDRYKTLAQ